MPEGFGGSPALALDARGSNLWGAYRTTVKPTTTIRFKLKALGPVKRAQIQLWSAKNEENGRYYVDEIPEGKWIDVRFLVTDVRMEWDRSGVPFAAGEKLDNFKISFTAGDGVRVLLDDLEVLE